jgi:hypothetical protein
LDAGESKTWAASVSGTRLGYERSRASALCFDTLRLSPAIRSESSYVEV